MRSHPSRMQANPVIVFSLLFFLITGCGSQTQSAPPSTSTPNSSGASSPATSSLDSLAVNKTGVSIDEGGLHIDASNGIQCPTGAVTNGPPDNPGNLIGKYKANDLVLATSRLTYDSNELQQIQQYAEAGAIGVQKPETLQWVLGGPTVTDTSRSLYLRGNPINSIDDCGLTLQITNTSQNILQIASVGVQLVADTQQNNYHYRLIDFCTLASDICIFGGGPSPCDQYIATIKLGAGSTNAGFSTSTAGSETCGELTLNPGDVKSLYVYFYSPQNLIYSLVPQLVVDTSSGPNTLTLTALTSTLAFANKGQFTCYGLHNDAFVAEMSPPPTSECI
jgi:hypothetical protein